MSIARAILDKVNLIRTNLAEPEAAKAGPIANRPGLMLDPLSHRWKRAGQAGAPWGAVGRAHQRRGVMIGELQHKGIQAESPSHYADPTDFRHGDGKIGRIEVDDDGRLMGTHDLYPEHGQPGEVEGEHGFRTQWTHLATHAHAQRFLDAVQPSQEGWKAIDKKDKQTLSMFDMLTPGGDGGKPAGDPSHGGALHQETRTDARGRTEKRWVATPPPAAAGNVSKTFPVAGSVASHLDEVAEQHADPEGFGVEPDEHEMHGHILAHYDRAKSKLRAPDDPRMADRMADYFSEQANAADELHGKKEGEGAHAEGRAHLRAARSAMSTLAGTLREHATGLRKAAMPKPPPTAQEPAQGTSGHWGHMLAARHTRIADAHRDAMQAAGGPSTPEGRHHMTAQRAHRAAADAAKAAATGNGSESEAKTATTRADTETKKAEDGIAKLKKAPKPAEPWQKHAEMQQSHARAIEAHRELANTARGRGDHLAERAHETAADAHHAAASAHGIAFASSSKRESPNTSERDQATIDRNKAAVASHHAADASLRANGQRDAAGLGPDRGISEGQAARIVQQTRPGSHEAKAQAHTSHAAFHAKQAEGRADGDPVGDKHREAALAHTKAARMHSRVGATPGAEAAADRLTTEAHARSRDVKAVADRIQGREADRRAADPSYRVAQETKEPPAPAMLRDRATPEGIAQAKQGALYTTKDGNVAYRKVGPGKTDWHRQKPSSHAPGEWTDVDDPPSKHAFQSVMRLVDSEGGHIHTPAPEPAPAAAAAAAEPDITPQQAQIKAHEHDRKGEQFQSSHGGHGAGNAHKQAAYAWQQVATEMRRGDASPQRIKDAHALSEKAQKEEAQVPARQAARAKAPVHEHLAKLHRQAADEATGGGERAAHQDAARAQDEAARAAYQHAASTLDPNDVHGGDHYEIHANAANRQSEHASRLTSQRTGGQWPPAPKAETKPEPASYAIDTGAGRKSVQGHRVGVYGVHDEAPEHGGLATVTHIPSGRSIAQGYAPDDALKLAQHLHDKAEGAHGSAAFGTTFDREHPDSQRMMAALQNASVKPRPDRLAGQIRNKAQDHRARQGAADKHEARAAEHRQKLQAAREGGASLSVTGGHANAEKAHTAAAEAFRSNASNAASKAQEAKDTSERVAKYEREDAMSRAHKAANESGYSAGHGDETLRRSASGQGTAPQKNPHKQGTPEHDHWAAGYAQGRGDAGGAAREEVRWSR